MNFEAELERITEQGRVIGVMQTKILIAKMLLENESNYELTPRKLAQEILNLLVPKEKEL